MAEENNEENQEAEAVTASGSKKSIIIIAIVTLLAIGLSVGATLYLLTGDDTEEETVAEEAVDEETDEGADENAGPSNPAVYYDIKPPILVTFNVGGRQRYMQLHVSVSTRSQAALDMLQHHMPLIRSNLISHYSSQDFNALQTKEGKIALRESTLNIVNEVLEQEGSDLIENVFFTNFVMQ